MPIIRILCFLITMVLPAGPAFSQNQSSRNISSTLEVYAMEFGERHSIYHEDAHFEAPNWSRDGQFFIINQGGLLYKISLDGQTKTLIDTGDLNDLNNDHGLSADGSLLAISNNDPVEPNDYGTSRIYILPMEGGSPKLATPEWPSYWHGWSPDSRNILYTAHREGDFDVYRMELESGAEQRLTRDPGLDDGPEYSPDGKYIYYNSMRSGNMELWRMNSDGSEKLQLTNDSYSNWFPHPSPDGRYLVFITYLENQGDRHPPMKDVALRLMDLSDNSIKSLCRFTGGQGSINVPSWSPDGSKLAFVSYQYLNDE